jgi:hypothetical protein
MNFFAGVVAITVGTVILLIALLAQVLEWRTKLDKHPTLKKLAEAKLLRLVLL